MRLKKDRADVVNPVPVNASGCAASNSAFGGSPKHNEKPVTDIS